ncbi:hypothetical protein JD844_012484 [Phrynosoma platyrhinos]|uniref:Uncharacterized protein n=1 Tax=Phrynosoma platyrhinos TaxID=52577 RepID=A0ABQ7TKE5_PHRPL|nr:hypothetical protein JD844_012484 [Phrynosoma platyrhinos]
MAKRKHSRTAEECRPKTKHIRFEYKRVKNYNKMSGRDLTTCPFFKELNNSLHGDASIVINRVSRSIDLQRGNQATGCNANQQREGPALGTAMPETQGNGLPMDNNELERGHMSAKPRVQFPPDDDDEIQIEIPVTLLEMEDNSQSEEERQATNTGVQDISISNQGEEQSLESRITVVNLSQNSHLQQLRNRSRRAVRGEHIARAIMENANQQINLSRDPSGGHFSSTTLLQREDEDLTGGDIDEDKNNSNGVGQSGKATRENMDIVTLELHTGVNSDNEPVSAQSCDDDSDMNPVNITEAIHKQESINKEVQSRLQSMEFRIKTLERNMTSSYGTSEQE